MMRPAIEWQERGEAFYFIADYHALTTVRDPAKLREYSRGVALDFLACGLDPAKAVLFKQSDVPAVTELSWILSTITPMPMLENAHAYKDHLAKELVPNHGLFAYPVLMAADILIYDSDVVPVGKDQKQHVEITRDLAAKMNQIFGDVFKIPEASILPSLIGEGAREVAAAGTRRQANKIIDAVMEYVRRMMTDGPWKPPAAARGR